MWSNPTFFHQAKYIKKNIEKKQKLTQLRKAFPTEQNLSIKILRKYKN